MPAISRSWPRQQESRRTERQGLHDGAGEQIYAQMPVALRTLSVMHERAAFSFPARTFMSYRHV